MRSFLQTDYLISANSFLTHVYKVSYKIKEIYNGNIIEVGYPRNDLLFSNCDYVVNKLKKYGVNINKKVILYAPTWRGATFGTLRNTVEEMLEFRENLLAKIDTNEYQVLLKPHQLLGKMFKEIGATDFVIPSTFDAGEALSITDILISDFSSIFFDFLTTKRPVLFYITDEEEYKEERGLYSGLDELPAEHTDDVNTIANWINNIDLWKKDNIVKYTKVRDFCENTDKNNISNEVLDIILNKKPEKVNSTRQKLLLLKGLENLDSTGLAMQNLLNYIDYDKYDVTVYIYESVNKEQRNFITDINNNSRILVRVSTFSCTLIERINIKFANEYCKTFNFLNSIFPTKAYEREITRCLGNTTFDYVIDFDGQTRMLSLLALHIPAKKHYIWQHTDMQKENNHYNWLYHIFSLYKNYDKIISSSKELMEINKRNLSYLKLDEKFTFATTIFDIEKAEMQSNQASYIEIDNNLFYHAESTLNKLYSIPVNLINTNNNTQIYSLKNKYDEYQNNTVLTTNKILENGVKEVIISTINPEILDIKTKFITVGKITKEKNHRLLIDTFILLLKEYPNITLYIIGSGKRFNTEYNYINKKKLQNNIIMINNLKNPIGLMQKCDCFVLPSLYEGQNLNILDAINLNMPIITTDFETASNSYIVNNDINSLYQGMKDYILGKIPTNNTFNFEKYNIKAYNEFEALFK